MKKNGISEPILLVILCLVAFAFYMAGAWASDSQSQKMERDQASMDQIQQQLKTCHQLLEKKDIERARENVDKAFAGLKVVPIGVTSGVYTGVYSGSVREMLADCAEIYISLGDNGSAKSAIDFGINNIPSPFGDQGGLWVLFKVKSELTAKLGNRRESDRIALVADCRRELLELRSRSVTNATAITKAEFIVDGATKCGDFRLLLEGLQCLYNFELEAKDYAKAHITSERRLQVAKKHGGAETVASSLVNIGDLYAAQGKKSDAEKSYLEAIKQYKVAGMDGDYVSQRLKSMKESN